MKRFEGYGLDTANQCLLRGGAAGGERLDLPPKPFAVLRYLVEHPDRLITHDELLDALWPETYVQPQVLRTYVQDLRKALGDDAAHPRFIQTLPKRGYRFLAQVSEAEELATLKAARAESHALATNQPLNQPASQPASTPLIGRDRELALLASRAGLLAAGQRQVVFITGESGIGKTALVDAFCRGLDPAAVSVARGQCVQGAGGTEDYYPVREALGQLCCGPELSLSSLCAAIEELAVAAPLVLVFEDLHWADEATLRLISALARRRGPARLMVMATCCPLLCDPAGHGSGVTGAVEDPLKRLQQDLQLRRLSVEMALPPLSKRSVAALLSRELGQQTLPAGLADFVCQRSEGNPLFVIAVLEHLLAQGMLVRDEKSGDWQQSQPWPELEAVVPHQLARMIELEVERLSHDEQRLLEAASLMPVAFPAWAVAAALELDAVEVEEACDRLARRLHFVVRAGQDELPDGARSAFYVFAHGLYRQVLYQRQAESRRARRHVRIAERLAVLFAGREASVARERAMHYQAAGDDARAAAVMAEAQPLMVAAD